MLIIFFSEYALSSSNWDGNPPSEIQSLVHNEREGFACNLIVGSDYSNLPESLPSGYAVIGTFLVAMVEKVLLD
jgi:hypothetical protein